MKLNNFGRFLTPKSDVFYTACESIADKLIIMSELLLKFINAQTPDIGASIFNNIESLEAQIDEESHNLLLMIGSSFITPFDREDIHYLNTTLEEIADNIYATSKRINFWHINTNDKHIKDFVDTIVDSCKEVKNVVYAIRDIQRNAIPLKTSLIKINTLENRADDIYAVGIDELFEHENDLKELLKKKEIYRCLETITDKCEMFAEVLESIIIKYS
ncbi:MAG: DUF47 family protein [Phycisphaerales bacterium]|nr:DUF47 family protein [Phycisphaerales bacterium]